MHFDSVKTPQLPTCVKRGLLLSGVLSVALFAKASADDLNVSTSTTSAVETATAANSSAGNITISTTGSVAISKAGAAVTLNSNNSVSNSGTISNSVGALAIGVQITGGNTGSFTNMGSINIPATDSPPTTTGQYGIILSGSDVFNGDIVTLAGSTLRISGYSANAIAIQSELNGNLTLGGSLTSTGPLAIGVINSAPIDGAFINTGTIVTDRGTATTSIPGSAVEFGSTVAGGFLNSGSLNGGSGVAAATISTVGTAAAVKIAPSVASNAADLTLGILADANNSGYSFLNRGNITATGDKPAVSATTIQIGNATDDTSGKMTVFSGGIYNSGIISAIATSDAQNSTSAGANANAIIISNVTTVPVLTNDSRGTITATTGGTLGGDAFGLVIQTGGSLAAINNAGIIAASANTSDPKISALTAYAIQDATGTLTHIVNSGTISATATVLEAGGQKTVAADLSAATSPIVFTNTGTVIGDLLFGSGSNSQLSIEGSNARMAGKVQAYGLGTINIAVSAGGTGGILETSNIARAGTITIGSGGTLSLGVGSDTPVVSAKGAVSFDATSRLLLTPTALLPSDNAITLIHSDTSLSFADFATTTGHIDVPFLFTGAVSLDTKNLILTLHRKTASELGLTGNAAVIYEPAMNAALNDDQFGAALSALGSAAAVQSAVEQMLPITSGAALAAAETTTDSNTDAVGTRQRTLLLDSSPDVGFGVWGRGLYNRLKGSGPDSYTGQGAGGVVGVDFNQPGRGHFGLALTIYRAQLRDQSPSGAKTDEQAFVISPYMGFRVQNFFLDAQFNAGQANLKTTRTVNIGSLSRIATGKPDQLLASGGISTGYILDLGFISLIPEVNLNAIELYGRSYVEEGGGEGVDLAVDDHHQSSFRGFAGVTAGRTYTWDDARFIPQVQVGWSQALTTSSSNVSAAFASTPDSHFTISGPASDRSHLSAGAGLDFVVGKWSVGINYSTMIGSTATSQTAILTFGARF